MASNPPVIIVGAGMGGFCAAITAAEHGLDPILVEKGEKVGGSCAFSGGQVWVGANHVAKGMGIEDSIEATTTYVKAIAKRDPASIDSVLLKRWVATSIEAARWLEERGAIRWAVIDRMADYYYPEAEGSLPVGRYLTCVNFEGARLGPDLDRLLIGPNFPVGITHEEMFDFGGIATKESWDWDFIKRRRDAKILSFGTGVAAWLFKAALDRKVRILTRHRAIELLAANGKVTGLVCATPKGNVRLEGPVILATGSLDWSDEYFERFVGIPAGEGGSVAPATLEGDGMRLAEKVGAAIGSIPAWAAPVVPGYRLPEPAWPGDHGIRTCWEQSMPHSFLVNRKGERFARDEFPSDIIAAALTRDANGDLPNFPVFMIWDESHHKRYGLGPYAPGTPYPAGMVQTAAGFAELAGRLGIDADGLERTAARFNQFARKGEDPDFGRGRSPWAHSFRGDSTHPINANLAPVETPPYYGMKLQMVNTGIAAAGVEADANGRALDRNGNAITGLYVVGEASVRKTAGVGYNSGYSLSRAMTFGYLAARDIARVNV